MRRPSPLQATSVALLLIGLGLFLIAPYALMVMLPALALTWAVVAGHFTGETAVAWASRVVARLRSRRPRVAVVPERTAPWIGPRGGLLIAAALASRPPPAA